MTRKREQPPDDEPERKERVIHTRVPESLEAELRERAQHLGISVSNLVRNVLGHAFGLVGDVVADGHAIARAAVRGRPAAPPPPPAPTPPTAIDPPSLDDILGWQPIVLGKNAVCARCNAILPKGTDAAAGLAEGSSPARLVICTTCLGALRA
ncbi:MAG: hypothetical protein KF773_29205 [Deltaproteobacteria bacterium]|nr:hypothetical protein [Deltaproteobacteria bacterium]MCW5808037.1 hypothetical protein [Deltaproteobacteria bacterium]